MKLTDKQLLEAYYQALELALDREFILMLEEEMKKRNLKKRLVLLSQINK